MTKVLYGYANKLFHLYHLQTQLRSMQSLNTFFIDVFIIIKTDQ